MKTLFAFLTLFIFIQSVYASSAVVFMYHRFGESTYSSTNIRVEQFKQHLEYLEKNNFNVWPFSKIVQHILNGKTIPEKTVAITIDDAYKSIYEKAYPLLKKKNFPFTVFVNTSVISTTSNSFMDWSQMKEMSLNGAEFANHSQSHDVLLPRKNESKKEWQKRLKDEIVGSQKILQSKLGRNTNKNPKIFSYPYGEYSLETAEYIKSLGYISVTQTSGVINSDSDLRALPRYPMSERFGDIDDFILKANTLPLVVTNASTFEPILKAQNPPKLVLKLKDPLKNINCFISSGERINVKWISDTEVEIQANSPLKAPRDRYTCTAKNKDSKWMWYSHLWIINNDSE